MLLQQSVAKIYHFRKTILVRTLQLILEYHGKDFVGWQRQQNGFSVQEALETALCRLTGEAIVVFAAGRTDAGVHAKGQSVSFSTPSSLPLHAFVHGTNAHLPKSVVVHQAFERPAAFHARYNASGKWYRYQIWNAATPSPLHADAFYHTRTMLDTAAMQQAADYAIGWHDFRAFQAADCERKTTTRLLHKITITPKEVGFGREIFIDVVGTAFLKNMVRILVGTLLKIGQHAQEIQHMQFLLTEGDRTQAGMTVPSHGLTLHQVFYDERIPYPRSLRVT